MRYSDRNRSTAATIPAAISEIGRSPSTSAKRPKVPIMVDDGRGECIVRTHALRENLLRVVGSLDQRSAFYIAESILS